MPRLTDEDILKLADLAKLELTAGEAKQFALEISQVLNYVEQLQEVDVEGLEPTYQVSGLKNVTRPDTPISYQAAPSELLKNTPDTQDGFIKVRRIL